MKPSQELHASHATDFPRHRFESHLRLGIAPGVFVFNPANGFKWPAMAAFHMQEASDTKHSGSRGCSICGAKSAQAPGAFPAGHAGAVGIRQPARTAPGEAFCKLAGWSAPAVMELAELRPKAVLPAETAASALFVMGGVKLPGLNRCSD